MKKFKVPKWVIYMIPVLFLAILEFTSVYHTTDNVLKDMVYSSAGQLDPSVSVIGIDEETLAAYGSMEDWGRDKLADIINVLCADPKYKPAVIAVDIGLYSHKDEETDAKLVEAVKNAGNVVVVSAASFGSVINIEGDGYTASLKATALEEPYTELLDAVAGVGHSNIFLDEDGYARHALGALDVNGKTVKSFAATVAENYWGEIDERFNQIDSRYYIEYSGLAGDYYGSLGNGLSFKRVLEGEIPAQAFAGGIVFIGAYASGMQDRYYTSTAQSSLMNGVEIQANAVVQILKGRYFTEVDLAGRLLMIVLFGLISCFVLYKTDYRWGMLVAFLVSAAYVGIAVLLFHLVCIILPILSPVLVMILPCIVRTIIEYLNMYQERQRLVSNFSRYMPQAIAEKVAQKAREGNAEDSANAFPGERKHIAVLFVDIRGFTTLSENMEPEEVAHMINSFLSVTTAAVFRYGGTIDKFIGDCTMALFNAPLDQEDYLFKAVCAGLDIQRRMEGMQAVPDDPTKLVHVGVGINCGYAMVGNIGTQYRMDYTAIGDTVNTASRMEGQAKPGEVRVSAEMYEALKDRVDFEYAGAIPVKGKKLPVDMYLVKGLKEDIEDNPGSDPKPKK